MRDQLVRLWERAFFRPASPLSPVACRVIVSGQALWILLSRPDLPDVVGWPEPFWRHADPLMPLRFGIVGLPPELERLLYLVLHGLLVAALFGVAPRITCALSALLLYHFAPFEEVLVGIPHTCFGGLTIPCLALFILSFTEKPDWRTKQSPEYRWPVALIQLLLAFSYLFPTVAKLRFSGPLWFTGDNIRQYLLGNHPITAAPWALWVAASPALCRLIALGTLALEALSPLVVLSSRFAVVFAAGALVFHAGIVQALGYFFPSLPLLLLYLDWDSIYEWTLARRGERPAFSEGR